MSRSLKIIVTLSLLLNAVLVSAGGAAFYKKVQLREEEAVLSSETREKLKNAVNVDKRKAFKNMRQLKEKSNALKSIVEAKDFDSAAYSVAMDELLDMKDQMARERASKMGQAMETLSIEERQKLSKALMRSVVQKPRKRQNQLQDRFNR